MRWLLPLLLLSSPVTVDSLTSFQRRIELEADGFKPVSFTATASSTLCEGKGPKKKCHEVSGLTDQDVATAWCEGARGTGGQLTLTFDREVKVGGLDLQPFFGKRFTLAQANARPSLVTVSAGGASTQFELEDVVATVEAQNEDRPRSTKDEPCGDETCASRDERLPSMRLTLKLPKPVSARTLTVRIDEAYEGARFEDLCIASLSVFAR
jgi:hypothetical protein